MTWEGESQTLRSPVFTNWDFSTVPITWESEGDSRARFATGDTSAPGQFVWWRSEYAPGEYLATSGANRIWKHADIDCRIAVEKIAGGMADDLIRQVADDLETYYGNANSGTAVFRTPESYLTALFDWDDAWLVRDWVCPVWLFSPGPTEQLLAGESANQLDVSQASHGFTVGDWVGHDGSSWVAADADSQDANGVVSTVTDTDNFTVTTGDIVKITAHGLTQGKLYLSTTAGEATSSEPGPGSPRQYLGKALDADYLLVQIGELLDL